METAGGGPGLPEGTEGLGGPEEPAGEEGPAGMEEPRPEVPGPAGMEELGPERPGGPEEPRPEEPELAGPEQPQPEMPGEPRPEEPGPAAVRALGRRLGGRAAAAAAVERVQAKERLKEKEVSEARVENIKLKHEIEKLESALKAQGEEAEAVQFIDFEQLKKENQKYSEKIDDLGEELLKLQKKISNTVQILSQFKEKLQFVEAENQGRKAELMHIEAILSQKRDLLTKTKQTRDRLRMNNFKLQQQCGLLGNETLLRDFEENVDTAKLFSQRLEILKRHHAGLILTCEGIKKKIKEAKSPLPC
nr:coiled-coil domain-containing protein 96 [Dromaius novaehollandiae]